MKKKLQTLKKTGLSLILFFLFLCGGFAAEAATGINVETHTADEIRAFIKSSGASASDRVQYDVGPLLTQPYSPGSLSSATLESAVAMVNQIRYIAGLSYNVTLDADYNQMAQAGALVNAVNGSLSHYPSRPAGMDDALFQLGYDGCSSSNIGMGYGTINDSILNGYMADDDSSNISRVGHRRWVLNPSMGKAGFGYAGRYTAMYAHDRSNTSANQYGVAWPAQMMPVSYFDSNYPWSISMGRFVDSSSVRVTLKRQRDGRTWNFSQSSADGSFYVNNDSYGQTGCIIFRPNGVGNYESGDVFEVNITGLTSPVSYTVTFFDLVPVTSVSFSKTELTLKEKSGTYCPTVTILPSNASNTAVTYRSSNTSVATVNSRGYLQTGTAGTATITATAGGKSASFTVKVEHWARYKATCTENSVCEACGAVIENALGHDYEVSVVKPTATKGGYTVYSCRRCSHTYTANATEPTGTGSSGSGASGSGNNNGSGASGNQSSGSTQVALKKGKTFRLGTLKYKITAYSASRKEVQVTGAVKKTAASIRIPRTVKYQKKTFKVTSIGKRAFDRMKNLKTVTIGNNVKTIYDSAFLSCPKLTKVVTGTGLTQIGTKAFYNCRKLKTIQIKSTKLKKVGRLAFKNIYAKATIKVPSRKLTAYKKLLRGKGQKSSVKIRR